MSKEPRDPNVASDGLMPTTGFNPLVCEWTGAIGSTCADSTAAGLPYYDAVDPDLLAEQGPVHPDVARQMAEGIRDRAGATWGISTTGVAGPGDTDDGPEGLVYVGIAGPDGSDAVELRLPPGRDEVRATTVERALELLVSRLT